MFDFDESADNSRKRQWCWTQMVGLYFVSGGQWNVNFGHHSSFTSRLKGIYLPTNRFSVTRRFVSQFGFDSLTGSLHRLPFLLLAIEQSGCVTCTNWMLFIAKCYVWSSGRQISWNGTHLGMIFCIIGMERQPHSHSNKDWTVGLNNASNIAGNLRCVLRICPRTGGSSECCFGIRLVHEFGGTHAWTSKLVAYTRFPQWGQWHNLAQDPALWMQLSDGRKVKSRQWGWKNLQHEHIYLLIAWRSAGFLFSFRGRLTSSRPACVGQFQGLVLTSCASIHGA